MGLFGCGGSRRLKRGILFGTVWMRRKWWGYIDSFYKRKLSPCLCSDIFFLFKAEDSCDMCQSEGFFGPCGISHSIFVGLLVLAIQVRGLVLGWWGLKIPQALVWEPYRWGKQANRMFVVVSFCLKIFAKYLILRMLRWGGGDFWHFLIKMWSFSTPWLDLAKIVDSSGAESYWSDVYGKVLWILYSVLCGFVECFFMDSALVEYPALVGGIWWTGGLVYLFWGNKKVTSLTSVLGVQNPQNCRYLLELSHTIQKKINLMKNYDTKHWLTHLCWKLARFSMEMLLHKCALEDESHSLTKPFAKK